MKWSSGHIERETRGGCAWDALAFRELSKTKKIPVAKMLSQEDKGVMRSKRTNFEFLESPKDILFKK